jgi:hypothetical protein
MSDEHYFFSRTTGQVVDYRSAKGWLSPAERALLYKIAANVGPMRYLINVGIEYGASLVCLRQGNMTSTITAIDLIGDAKLDAVIPGPLIIVKGDSTILGRLWKPQTASLAFIDGGHDSATVAKDALLWANAIAPGGYLLFHDTAQSPAQDDVNRAVSEWFNEAGNHYFRERAQVDSIRWFERIGMAE